MVLVFIFEFSTERGGLLVVATPIAGTDYQCGGFFFYVLLLIIAGFNLWSGLSFRLDQPKMIFFAGITKLATWPLFLGMLWVLQTHNPNNVVVCSFFWDTVTILDRVCLECRCDQAREYAVFRTAQVIAHMRQVGDPIGYLGSDFLSSLIYRVLNILEEELTRGGNSFPLREGAIYCRIDYIVNQELLIQMKQLPKSTFEEGILVTINQWPFTTKTTAVLAPFAGDNYWFQIIRSLFLPLQNFRLTLTDDFEFVLWVDSIEINLSRLDQQRDVLLLKAHSTISTSDVLNHPQPLPLNHTVWTFFQKNLI